MYRVIKRNAQGCLSEARVGSMEELLLYLSRVAASTSHTLVVVTLLEL